MRECLAALCNWHDTRYHGRTANDWYLPGRDPKQPTAVCSLTQALRRACRALQLPHMVSHGLRAYYVRVLRAQEIDDSEISKRLGQRSGVGLVERVYGLAEPGWFGSKALDWLPAKTGQPGDVPVAWAKWLPLTATNIITLDKSA